LASQRDDWTACRSLIPDGARKKLALIDKADAAFATEESRAAYDAELLRAQAPTAKPDRDAERKANYERYCTAAQDYFGTREYDLAEVAITKALKNAPADGADLRLCLLAANVYYESGKYSLALDYQNDAIVQNPDDVTQYLRKYEIVCRLRKSDAKDRRGTLEQREVILRVAISKAEKSCDHESLAKGCSHLSHLLFSNNRSSNEKEAAELARRALVIDSTLEGANHVFNTLKEEESARRVAVIRRLSEDAGFKVLHLDETNHRALVITEDCIAKMPYHEPGGEVIWEACTLRRWLNNEFYDSLPPQVKSLIIEVTSQNNAGGPTQDKVFLLSVDEANKYFENADDRRANYEGSAYYWWLRSRGSGGASRAAGVDLYGDVDVNGGNVDASYCAVRPALWVSL
jgi:tetratricopeptide (TPR) repeat protein